MTQVTCEGERGDRFPIVVVSQTFMVCDDHNKACFKITLIRSGHCTTSFCILMQWAAVCGDLLLLM